MAHITYMAKYMASCSLLMCFLNPFCHSTLDEMKWFNVTLPVCRAERSWSKAVGDTPSQIIRIVFQL